MDKALTFREKLETLLGERGRGLTVKEIAAGLGLPIPNARSNLMNLCRADQAAPTGEAVMDPESGRAWVLYDLLFWPKVEKPKKVENE